MAGNDLMDPEANVQRIMKTGSAWFLGAVGSIAITMGLLLASGWRPFNLPTGLQILFWVGCAVTVASVGLLGWSGCPILEVDVATANRNKTRTMQLGTAAFILGGTLTLVAILLTPVF